MRSSVWRIAIVVAGLAACKKSSGPGTPSAAVSLISPSSGPYGTVVTIKGKGFNADPGKDSVWFNGVAAVVQAAADTQLTVIVPKSAGTGPVTILTFEAGAAGGSAVAQGPVFSFIYTADVYTISGNSLAGLVNASDSASRFSGPCGLALDSLGTLYVADFDNNSIRGLTGAGNSEPYTAFQVAGAITAGNTDGVSRSARFHGPIALAMDVYADAYVADALNNELRIVDVFGNATTLPLKDSSTQTPITITYPQGVAMDPTGVASIYISDYGGRRVLKVSATTLLTTTLAGSGVAGSADGVGIHAQFNVPSGLGVDAAGNVYVTDEFNNTIRKITPGGTVTTFAGTAGTPSYADGQGSAARFSYPSGVALDGAGNIYVADTYNDAIRKITPGGLVSTLAGTPGTAGYQDGPGNQAQFNLPHGVAVDKKGNVYVGDTNNNRIRKIIWE